MAKKILFVTGSKNLSGADLSMYALINEILSKKLEVEVILSGTGKTSSFLQDKNISYTIIPFKNWKSDRKYGHKTIIKRFAKIVYNKFLILKYYKKFEKENICCIYNNGFTNDFSVMLAKKLNKPCIYHIREFGDLDFKWNFDKKNKYRQYESIEKNVDIFIAISNAVKQSFSKAKNYEKIKVIYNGIKKIEINNKKKKSDVIRIIISGRLGEEKGHLSLLKAIRKIISLGITNIKLDIYGDGKEKENIENFIKENNLQSYVELKGFVLGIDYQQYDIGIMASRAEAFGRVTIEYMMNGLVTIAANSGANPELITNYIDGILFTPNDEIDLANKIMDVINSEKMRKSISKNAIKTAQEKFSEETYVNNIYNLLISENIIK